MSSGSRTDGDGLLTDRESFSLILWYVTDVSNAYCFSNDTTTLASRIALGAAAVQSLLACQTAGCLTWRLLSSDLLVFPLALRRSSPSRLAWKHVKVYTCLRRRSRQGMCSSRHCEYHPGPGFTVMHRADRSPIHLHVHNRRRVHRVIQPTRRITVRVSYISSAESLH